ncbi:hypothetical protein [Nocardiopsis algeriensis]|uniref:Anti-sigma factor RsiW n=1 Tax=Nocardiopsis algeriensis TaxID=1478215 RepID=A0A841IS60_9ACTN|nr:anti-sigma factor RsiW [Nocardiopsis algeriensis]
MTSHPDVEALAFFAEELLEPAEERTVADHLQTCTACATALDELSEVSRALADVPLPSLPQDVADLLDQRVATAVRERSAQRTEEGRAPAGPPPAERPGGATVVPISRARRRGFHMPGLLLVAAAAVVVGGGGAMLYNGVLADRGAETGAAAPLMESSPEHSEPDTAQSYRPVVVGSGTAYTEAGLADQAAEVLAAGTAFEQGPGIQENTRYSPEGCAAALGEQLGTRFTLVDDAGYEGAPAWVLFAPEGEKVDVYVVGTDCTGDANTDVLAFETVEAP